MSLNVGQIIDEYRIMAELGSGGNGIVYKAQSLKQQQIVALKIPWKERVKKNPSLVDIFLRETSALARLGHPHIARYYTAGTYSFSEEGQPFSLPYAVMELVEGIPFSDFNRGSLRRIVTIMQKVVDAVAYAHGKGVVHRDLKPSNIIVVPRDNPKILDFGLAQLMDEIATSSGIFEGSPSYAAPEQFKGEVCDERTDIWTLGTILYELLAGQPPFIPEHYEQLTEMQKIFAIQEQAINKRPTPPSRYNHEVDSYLDQVCLKALAKDPKDRYQSAEEMVVVLKNWGRINRDIWAEKARRAMKVSRFLPLFLGVSWLNKAYRYLEKGLGYYQAGSMIKEDLLKLLAQRGIDNVAIIELTLPEDLTPPKWQQLQQAIEEMARLKCDYLIPIERIVSGIYRGEELPHQVLAVYKIPQGQDLRSQIGRVDGETTTDLAYKIVKLVNLLKQKDIEVALPEPQEIFIAPTQIVGIGWPFRQEKSANALNIASLLYYILCGYKMQMEGPDLAKVPDNLRDVIKYAVDGRISTPQEFIDAMERRQQALNILEAGVLDRPFCFPCGEYSLNKSLRIEKNGHLILEQKTTLQMEVGVKIECYGQITVNGDWDGEQGSVRFVPVKIKQGWGGIHIWASSEQTQEFAGCVFEGGRGTIQEDGSICGGAISIEGGSLKIKGALFRDNKVEASGGAIYLGGQGPVSAELNDIVFTGNNAAYNGGAIAIDTVGQCVLEQCRFIGNRSGEEGGGVYSKGIGKDQVAEVILNKCRFEDNRSSASGGALSANTYSLISSQECQYDSNIADDSGGAIVTIGKEEEVSRIRLTGCKFSTNRSQIRGGAVATKKHTVIECEDCRFDGNSSDRDSGGAVAIDGKNGVFPSKASIRRSTFSENRCRIDGGAVNANVNSDTFFEDCRFENNSAEDNSGGAVVILGESAENFSVCKFQQCYFHRNRCRMDGGAVNANVYTRTSFEDCRFKNNSAEDSGGAFEVVGEEGDKASEANFQQVVFNGNRCRINGGAVNAVDATCTVFEKCQFEHNRCDEDGGAVQIKGTDLGKYSEATFRNNTFDGNRSKQSGGALNIGVLVRAKCEGCDFKANQAEGKHGGAIQMIGQRGDNPTEITFRQVNFVENTCKMDGGALHVGDYSLAVFDKIRFDRNNSENSGGAISLAGRESRWPTKMTFRRTIFTENRCLLDGGAIASGYHTRMILTDCQFNNNSAESNCGAIGIAGKADEDASKAKFTRVVFVGNHCKSDGGAIAAGTHSQMIFEKCRFENNWAEGTCGAIGVAGKDKHNLSDATFTDVAFVGNRCTVDGGAMVISRYSRTKFDRCLFDKNEAEKKTGGAILILGKEPSFITLADFQGVTFRENRCRIDGGAINANVYTQVSFHNCIFEKNLAREKNGGAIVLLGRDGNCPTKASFQQVIFRQNQCRVSGGAINANDYTRSHFTECVFEENRAFKKNGGAVLVLGEDGRYPSEARFVKVKFKKNYCLGSGGAVNANVFTICHFEGCFFEKNVAEEHGGGIFIRGLRRVPNKATVKSCHFLGNIAGKIGADVALNAVKGVTEQSLLHDNTIEIPEPDFLAEEIEEQRQATKKLPKPPTLKKTVRRPVFSPGTGVSLPPKSSLTAKPPTKPKPASSPVKLPAARQEKPANKLKRKE